ncbi:hypothetical protein HPSA_00660 [Helicobacter pylori SouthAfrica7]|uniref:Uncharacterized protein n=1 Tax=Helicobacter pylori (strain SouthAfrica7) TaxID=907239 RepID=E8QU58_HELPW|nr:hypothetical protein HPSA_00660 [Helicobacter pylori SouthAfrica7]
MMHSYGDLKKGVVGESFQNALSPYEFLNQLKEMIFTQE